MLVVIVMINTGNSNNGSIFPSLSNNSLLSLFKARLLTQPLRVSSSHFGISLF